MKDVSDADVSVWMSSSVEDQLRIAQHLLVDCLDSADQGRVSFIFAVAGTCFVLRGFALVKPAFVVSVSLALALRVEKVAAEQHSRIAGSVCALVVAACSCVLMHRLYPVVLFLTGSGVAGLGTVLLRNALNLENSHKELLALSILVSVPGGLLCKEFRTAGWRLLTPVAGAYLLAASCQYWEEDLSGLRVKWTAAMTGFPPVFVATWGFGTLAGWYCQIIGPLFGDDPCRVPVVVSRKLQLWHRSFPFLLDDEGTWQAQDPGEASKAFLSEPFLRGSSPLQPHERHCRREWSRVPGLVIGFSILVVLLLNGVLISQPILVLGHGVLMSLAFLPLTTAGLLCYSSEHSRFCGRGRVMEPIMRHAAHATMGVLVLLCALLGCLSIYWNRLLTAEPVLSTWSRGLHVLVGYSTMALLCLTSFSGAAKLLAAQKGERQQDVAPYHPLLGKLIYVMAAFNQVQGFFLQDLIPRWMALLLTVMVLICVTAVLAFMCGFLTPERLPAAPLDNAKDFKDAKEPEMLQVQLLGRLSPEVAKAPRGRQRQRTRRDWDAVVGAFETQDANNMMSTCFLRWHRFAQSAHIAKAHAELQSSDNLVNFLSSTLLGEMRWREVNLGQNRERSYSQSEATTTEAKQHHCQNA